MPQKVYLDYQVFFYHLFLQVLVMLNPDRDLRFLSQQ